MLHVGTLGLTFEPIATALEAVVEHLAGTALVAVDPNCRPGAIDDPAAYRARLRRILRRTHVVKVSEDDLAWLDPGRPPRTAARALLGFGPAVVLLTCGAKGARVMTADDEIVVPVPATQVVDTIGAGDAFGGGFLAWWRSQGLGRESLADTRLVVDAARFAALVAARTCERAGASPPHLSELEAG
jgi:fructokinase